MRNSTKVSSYERDAMRKAREHGSTIEAIAIRYRRSRTTVRNIVKGIPAKHANAKTQAKRPHQNSIIDREPVTVSTVCVWKEGGKTSVSHGLGKEHARATLAAIARGRTPAEGYPKEVGG